MSVFPDPFQDVELQFDENLSETLYPHIAHITCERFRAQE